MNRLIGCGLVFQLVVLSLSIAFGIMTLAVILWLFHVNVIYGIIGIVGSEVLLPAIVLLLIGHAFGAI